MKLTKYNKARNFNQTPEPKGKKISKNSSKNLYFVQKHAASHLHYDFRLELNGVLISWAVPKGPCLDPNVKRLAVHVEDHPVEYGSFEGVIPKGQYGAGTVMLWDTGKWISEDSNPAMAYKKGKMKFTLKGKKLKGSWKLIRINKDDKTWLLIKSKDKYAKNLKTYDVTREKSDTVTSSQLTNPDKILYLEDKFTKQDLESYYKKIHKWILPYIKNRPLTLLRCPSGYKECFYQKHMAESFPEELYGVSIKEKNSMGEYIYLKNKKGFLALSQLGVLELHPWRSTIKNLEYPDMIIFDLDPSPEIKWIKVVEAAKLIKKYLVRFKLTCFVKTTGGKGLHVVIPIKPKYNWDEIKHFAQTFVEFIVENHPDDYVGTISKRKRKGKIFIDYLRNQRGSTAIAPYSTRARKHAPVSTPLSWNELTNNFKDTAFTIKTLPLRLEKLKKDPWRYFFKIKQILKFK